MKVSDYSIFGLALGTLEGEYVFFFVGEAPIG